MARAKTGVADRRRREQHARTQRVADALAVAAAAETASGGAEEDGRGRDGGDGRDAGRVGPADGRSGACPIAWPGLAKRRGPKLRSVPNPPIHADTVRNAVRSGRTTLPGAAVYRDRLRDRGFGEKLDKLKGLLDTAEPDPRDLMATRRREALVKGLTGKPSGVIATMLRFVPGGRKTYVGLMERAALNGDEVALRWMHIYTDLTKFQQERVSLDDIGAACDVTPDQAMAIVVATGVRMGADMADLVASVMQPKVVAALATSAVRISGKHADVAQEDRRMLLQHHKFIPVPRGVMVNVRANANAQAAAAAASQPSVPKFRESLEGAADAQREIQDRFTKRIEGVVVEDPDVRPDTD